MSFATLLDHTATIYRATVTRGTLRDEVRGLEVVGAASCAVRRPAAILASPGPGLTPVGQRVLYFEAAVDIALRDVLLLAGADTGTYEVEEPPTRPRGHHLEVRARVWAGVLPVVVAS